MINFFIKNTPINPITVIIPTISLKFSDTNKSDIAHIAKYKYTTVLEDSLCKMSCFSGLEQYRSSNEYSDKADKIREANEALTAFADLQKAGMGKESLKRLMAWLNEEKKLKISKKALMEEITEADIPEEIQLFFNEIKNAMT